MRAELQLQSQAISEGADKAALLKSFARAIRDRRMESPAVLCLETMQPLSTVLHSAALVSQPLLSALFGAAGAAKLVALLESREDIERLIALIEDPAGGEQ